MSDEPRPIDPAEAPKAERLEPLESGLDAMRERDKLTDCCACELRAKLIALRKTAKRLEAQVRRFRHTADGVPMVYGDTVYWWEDERVQSGIWRGIGSDGPTVEQPTGDLCWPPIDWLNSTPEAAKASQ